MPIAQINVGRLTGAKDGPEVAEFMARLDAINAVADAAPGFIWRLQDEAGNATDLQPTSDERFIVNMSVWTLVAALSAFVYRTGHAEVMAKRRAWFEPHRGAFLALWPVADGHRPTIDEGLARLWHLDRFGPTARAFGFRDRGLVVTA